MRVNPFKAIHLFQNVNPVIRLLISSDILFSMSRLGLVTPVFAVYITDTIEGGDLEVVGIATAIFLLAKSLLQIPASTLIDKIRGEKDDFWAMFAGTAIIALAVLLYAFINTPWQLYLLQFIYGAAAAIAFPAWMAIFTRHIDREHEGLEWGIYFTMTDLATAAAAAIAGMIAYRYGFVPLFVIATFMAIIGQGILYSIRSNLKSLK
ncbi:MAG: MFS transporter [Planctomycetes bacterium]|jgi:MFS family permease|nr:MFS transporter [Planctomycetota bacterium]